KLLQQIGEGGCGIVFMAEQDEPVHRRVAIKIIKPGMDTKSVIARFEAERQALALMDHPNIARVFDAGTTESGRPYFVMQLIQGVKITEYCDQQSLTTRERLKLFIQVCQAVQHAHQKGIIHRDIKPSNILVSENLQGGAMPMVIDFGIAKATTSFRLTDKTLFTAFELLIGTPAYMSPEQAALTSVDVDTRTDIYSLGVLLYELLTGLTPFDTGELLKVGLDEIRRVILEKEPLRPSTRLSKMSGADLTTAALRRKAEPPSLIHVVRGDLDWIAMKALEKDRTRRYETAYGMALDVQRYLSDEPIAARPPGRLYKLRKMVQRNKLLFVGLTIIALLLVLSLIVVSTALANERNARREAVGAFRQAQTDKVKAQQVTQFLEDMLAGVGPSVAHGRDTGMMQEILDRTASRIGVELTNQPAVQAELCSLIGQISFLIGNYGQSEQVQREALALNEKLFGPESKEAALSLSDLGLALFREGKLPEAESAQVEALAIRRQLFGNNSAAAGATLNDLSSIYRHQRKLSQAEALARESIRIRQKLYGDESLKVAESMHNLSLVLSDEGKGSEAEATAWTMLAMRRKLLGPDDVQDAYALNDVAWVAGENGKSNEAEALLQESLSILRKRLGDTNPDVAKTLSSLGDRVRQRGNLTESESILREALAMQSKLVGENAPDYLFTLDSLGSTLDAEAKWTEDEQVHRQAFVAWRKLNGAGDPRTVGDLWGLIHALMAQQKYGDTEQALNDALTPEFSEQPASAELLSLRSELEARRGQWEEAAADDALAFEHQPSKHELFSILAALYAKNNNRTAYGQLCNRLLLAFAKTTDFHTADQVAKSCLFLPLPSVDLRVVDHLVDIPLTNGISDSGAMPYFQVDKALCEYRLGHYATAAEWAQKPLQIPGSSVHAQAYAVLAMADWQLGKREAARTMLVDGESLTPVSMPLKIAEDPSNEWQDWLLARIQLDEADTMIQAGSRTTGSAGKSLPK
ncbi:MAG: serine/threonine-protein kinase, partial [Verrucomicrobiota bacterium]